MITNLFDSVLETLSRRWKSHHEPRSKRAFRCECDTPVFFRNSECLNCHSPLGYEPVIGDLRALHPGEQAASWRPVGADIEQDYRRCANFDSPAGCNWLVPARDDDRFCVSCRLNRAIPDLEDADNRRYWGLIEAGKRRLISQLLALELPVVSRQEDPKGGLAFDLLRSTASGPRVMTGHAGGIVTPPIHADIVHQAASSIDAVGIRLGCGCESARKPRCNAARQVGLRTTTPSTVDLGLMSALRIHGEIREYVLCSPYTRPHHCVVQLAHG